MPDPTVLWSARNCRQRWKTGEAKDRRRSQGAGQCIGCGGLFLASRTVQTPENTQGENRGLLGQQGQEQGEAARNESLLGHRSIEEQQQRGQYKNRGHAVISSGDEGDSLVLHWMKRKQGGCDEACPSTGQLSPELKEQDNCQKVPHHRMQVCASWAGAKEAVIDGETGEKQRPIEARAVGSKTRRLPEVEREKGTKIGPAPGVGIVADE